MGVLAFLKTIFGIGGNYLQNRQKLKELKQEQEHEIVKAETVAVVDRIMSNTKSDNEIDLITARNKRYTLKDEFITYLFMIPVVVATSVPFLTAWSHDDWLNLNQLVRESYLSLDTLPQWYKYVLYAIVIDVLGFRSFARNVLEEWKSKRNKQ